MRPYDESYLNDAQCHLGEMFDYAIRQRGEDADAFWTMFSHSTVSRHLFAGNPRYLAGMSGTELYGALRKEMDGIYVDLDGDAEDERSPEYWAGWSLSYYQWYRGVSCERLALEGIRLSAVIDSYILHEADVDVFVQRMDHWRGSAADATLLKRLRAYAGMTQKELSEASGVKLRMIQLYEQGQNDLSKASYETVESLALSLGCKAAEL